VVVFVLPRGRKIPLKLTESLFPKPSEEEHLDTSTRLIPERKREEEKEIEEKKRTIMVALFKFTIKLFHFLRNPLNRPLEPLLWVASTISAKRAFKCSSSLPAAAGAAAASSIVAKDEREKKTQILGNRLFPAAVVLVQAKLDGTRWQVVPAYVGTGLTVLVDTLDAKLKIRIPNVVRKTSSVIGFATAFSSVFAGLFIPVFRMPKPTGPHKVGKRRFYWQDTTRKSWIRPDHPRRKKLPEHRKLMADIWYPAELEEKMQKMEEKSGNKTTKTKRRKVNWLDPDLARALAISFWAPGWVVNYFRLVLMDASDSPHVASEPHPEGSYADEITGKFPIVVFSHSFSGMKEQNSALLQELASWGHICVAADHPHDAALVLYPDGSSADFRGYDQPEEMRPKMWWKFRHRHLKYRTLDLQFVLDRLLELNEDKEDPLHNTMDDTRIAACGHSFGGAASGMFAQLDKRVTSVIMLDPWMWPMGRSCVQKGIPVPLLVFEAPRFLGNRDIFCIENDHSSSTLALATAPQCARVYENVDNSIDNGTSSALPQPKAIDFVDVSTTDERDDEDADDNGENASRTGRPPLPPLSINTGVVSNALEGVGGEGERHLRSNSFLNDQMMKHSFSSVSIADSLAESDYEFFGRNSRDDRNGDEDFEYAPPSGVCYKAVLEETMHFDYTDLAMVAPLTTRLLGMIAVGGSEVHDVISRASLRFLHAHNRPRRKHVVTTSNAPVYEFDAETLMQRTRMLHPGPWPGCPADEKDMAEIIEKKTKSMKKEESKKNSSHSRTSAAAVDSAMKFGVASNKRVKKIKENDAYADPPSSPREILKNLTPFSKVRDAILEAETDERWKNKGGFVRWIDIEQFANEREDIGDDRPWTAEQLREVRWLLSETEDKDDLFVLKRSDWIAMFPNRSEREIRRALEIIENDQTEHPPPKPLSWMVGENPDVIIDGPDDSGDVHSSDDEAGGNDAYSPRFLIGGSSRSHFGGRDSQPSSPMHVVKPRAMTRIDSSLRP